MPYKKQYHTIHCPKCDQDYQVLTPAYLRKMKDTKYGALCTKCRAKVQWEEMTDEEKAAIKEKAKVANKKAYENMSDEKKKELIAKRTAGTKKYRASMSNEDKARDSIIKSKNRLNYLNNLSEEERKAIGNNISKGKLEAFANMTDEERDEWKLQRQKERELYWNNLSKEKKESIINQLRINNQNYIINMTDEERQKRSKFMTDRNNEFWSKLSDDRREEFIQKLINGSKKWRVNLSKEELKEINRQRSEAMQKYWNSLSKEELNKISETRAKRYQEWLAKMSEDEYNEYIAYFSNIMKDWWNSLPDEEREIRNEENRNRWNSLPDEIKNKLRKEASERWNSYTQEERDIITTKRLESYKEYLDNLSDEERSLISKRAKDAWESKSDEEKAKHIKHTLSSNKINNLNIKFEKTFNESHLINEYYIKSEELLINNHIMHSWDYGIYSKSTNELVMVVDLDGKYFHADECDYDGFHSQEEYDERRSLSIPTNSNIKHFIIQELNFKKCFELMIKTLIIDYDEYVANIFKICRSMPFPNPKYTDIELMRSYSDLCKMKTDDKYHKNISLNTRLGDRLITHFHESIYQANRKGDISPYEAWYDDKLLMKVIKNRIIYQNYLNPNKILQGFNISKVATKVSVFSAGRAKMLINRYLSDCNEIFDPFSGFSGRMLGTISLGKRYIGQDISDIHTRESNNMIKFLLDKGFDIDANIECKDILNSNGTYECLFTCSPYSDIEQWYDVPADTRSCDDWIDECLNRFNCRKYLFVVDNTEKYKDYIVDEIRNKSHFGKNKEYVILITK